MKKILFVMLLCFIQHSYASQFKLDTHYEIINYNVSPVTKPKVTEYFSFLCPHCYNFEKNYIPTLATALSASNVVFEQHHVDFIGGALGASLSKAYALSYQLNVDKKIKPLLFEACKADPQQFSRQNALKQFFLKHGVNEQEYDANINAFIVNTKVAQMHFKAKKSKIKGVPAFVVNEKYLIKNESVKSYEELTKLILYLSKKSTNTMLSKPKASTQS
ncbi:MAG: thiol:disulfide interchange protein DsbA/DsbL [Shewanellaceae bacterium]|nr:thiol:disulfide interchange protein DsbA/DsbL [Shewanellaceae bacterium]